MYNTAVMIFNIVVVIMMIYSLINYFSHKSNTKQAEKKASKLAKELNNLQSDEVEIIQATAEELVVLDHYYNIDTNEPATIIETDSDDIQISSLTENGRISDLVLTVFEAKIEIPFNFLNILKNKGISTPDNSLDLPNLKLAVIDEKIYLLSIGDLSLVEEYRQEIPELKKWDKKRELEKQVRELSKNNVRGQIDSLPLIVTGERDATENENWYFDPSNKGIAYTIVMALIFTFAPLNDPELGFISLAVCTATFLIGFIIWYISNKAKRKKFKVTKLRGKFHEMEEKEYGDYAYIYDNQKVGKTTFSIPDYWQSKNKFPLQQEVNFEVLSGTNDIVSIGDIHSLENNFKTQRPTRKYFPWMIITLIVFAINLCVGTNLQQAKLAFQMLFAPSAIEINTLQDWSSIKAGQHITAKNINRQCILVSEDTEPNERWTDICDQFNIVDKAPNTDFTAVAKPILEDLKKVVDTLTFPTISDAGYASFNLRMRLIIAMQGETNTSEPIQQSYIAEYDSKILSSWANWVDKNDKDNQKIKDKLLSMWNVISDKACTVDCWDEILQGGSEESMGLSYERRNELSAFSAAVDNYAQKKTKELLIQWKDALNSVMAPGENKIQVTAVGMDTPHEYWDSLLYSYQRNYFRRNKSVELISTIINSTEELHKMESTSIMSVVVSSIHHGESGTEIVLDLTMTDYLYISYLIRSGLLLFILLFALWITRKELHPPKS